MVLIFGKDSCPYTQAAIREHEQQGIPFKYVNVKTSAAEMQRMLTYSRGVREVPVIVDGDRVTIGCAGGT
jgi:glutaredoxin 3